MILRENYAEGYVNINILEVQTDGDDLWVFTTKKIENAGGMRARLHIQTLPETEFTEQLDLANKDTEFITCVKTRMTRLK